ncbi:MAG: hypothetical protein DDT23_01072 [candidate division WS2 bacterium]|nr:hypothetical protein [Candidatus Lithacetigena glycinireducens]
MFTVRKKEADKICKYFSVDIHFHPVCSASDSLLNTCRFHSTEEGFAGADLEKSDMQKFVLHRCDKLKSFCDNLGHLPAKIAFQYCDQLETDKLATVTLSLSDGETRIHMKSGRNEPCPCGTGKKYKKCCGR